MPDVYKEALAKEAPVQTPVAPYVATRLPSCGGITLTLTGLQPLLQEVAFLLLNSTNHEIGNLSAKRVKLHMAMMLMDLAHKYSSLRIPILIMLLSKKQKQPFSNFFAVIISIQIGTGSRRCDLSSKTLNTERSRTPRIERLLLRNML
jgi:hypothetical protein